MAIESVEWHRTTPIQAADWIEVKALIEISGTASKGDLHKVQSLGMDSEDEHGLQPVADGEPGVEVEVEIVNPKFDAWVDAVLEELDFRATALGDSYPFKLTFVDDQWSLHYKDRDMDQTGLDRQCYIGCLLVTAVRFNFVRTPDGDAKKSYATGIDTCLQILAYLAAGPLIGGEAYWFGWPRPDDSTTMSLAISRLFARMGVDGRAGEIPKWASNAEKDAGVDVVAWRNFGDGLPGRLLLLGQVASGRTNWKDKSVADLVESQFREWMAPYYQRFYVPAHFIAWPQYFEESGVRADLVHKLHHIERSLGVVVDRLRLTELVATVGRDGADVPSEHQEHLRTVAEWRERILTTARAA